MSEELEKCRNCGSECDPKGWMRGDGVQGPECEGCGITTPDVESWNRLMRTQLASTGGEAVAWKRRDGVMGCKRFMTQKCYDAQSAQMKGNYEPFHCANCAAIQPAPGGVVVDRELLALAVSLPSKESAEANHAGIVTRGAAQAALRALLKQAGGE